MYNKDDKVLEKLVDVFEDTDCTPDDILLSLWGAWDVHCAARKERGLATIRKVEQATRGQI